MERLTELFVDGDKDDDREDEGQYHKTDAKPSTATKAALDAALPPLTLTFGSVSIQAAPTESYLFPYMGEAWCSALLTDPSVSSELPLASIIGSPILRSSIVIFDREKNRIGFAPHAACP